MMNYCTLVCYNSDGLERRRHNKYLVRNTDKSVWILSWIDLYRRFKQSFFSYNYSRVIWPLIIVVISIYEYATTQTNNSHRNLV